MMVEILLGSVALSIIHIVIPNHWVPIAVIGKAEGWGRLQLRKVAAIAGISHSMSTVIIGVAVGLLGLKLTAISLGAMKLVGPSLFVFFGALYWIAGIRDNIRKHAHRHLHLDEAVGRSGRAAGAAIAVSMFFAPCLEIEAYFFNASVGGWRGIAIVGLTYVIISVIGVIVMVELGRKGLEMKKFHFLEHYEKHIMGIILIVMAIVTYFLLSDNPQGVWNHSHLWAAEYSVGT